MTTTSAIPRIRARRLSVVLLTAILALGWALPVAPAAAVTFDPGNIISDGVFYNPSTMTAAQVDAFIAERGAGCAPSASGVRCLKDYRESTWTRSGTVCAGTYQGGSDETAGTIITKVARACNINPQVLLVTLQKEQGLLTSSGGSLTARRYQIAMGFGCPDTAPCDAQYYGFYNQVYSAAQQFQRYAQNPSRYGYRAEMTNRVAFHPNASCGASSVYIANKATAALYNYTPYQPNSALLQGGGDGCSSYGNHNFWRFFNSWFGNPQQNYSVVGEFRALWTSIGGDSSPLGVPTTNQQWGIPISGSYQLFAGGAIYSTPTTGPHYLTAAFREPWKALGSERGVLGYPTTDPIDGLRDGGSFQNFQGGSMHYSPAFGAVPTYGNFRAIWVRSGFENGPLGYPRYAQGSGLPEGGSYQIFERGAIYSSPATGAHTILDPFRAVFFATSAERGILGYPVGSTTGGLREGGSYQHFQGGSIYSSRHGAFAIPEQFKVLWAKSGWENGSLGYPIGAVTPVRAGGTYQHFEGGSIYSSARGTHIVRRDVLGAWGRQGYENGPLGYPTTAFTSGLPLGGSYQEFDGGVIYDSPGVGLRFVNRAIHTVWGSTGWERGSLGYPVTDTNPIKSNGFYQHFENGSIYASPSTGTHIVTPAFLQAWGRTGYENGPLGYPTSARQNGLVSGGSYQEFEGGAVYTSPTTGTYSVSRLIRTAWSWTGWERGTFGYPLGDQQVGNGVIYQQFQGGTIYVRTP